jgi:leucyl-tRNA---protein transferase
MAVFMTSVPLLLTTPHACGYIDGLQSQTLFVHPRYELDNATYSQLIQRGFRRSGGDVYTPHCPNCTACVPTRLAVQQFQPNRSQQRCWKRNRQTTAVIKSAVFDSAHYQLYLHYQQSRHTGGDMAHSSPDDYLGFLTSAWSDTAFVEFFIANELAGVAVVDSVDNALSAVYTFFDPKFSHYSLGVYAVLWQIELAKQQHKEFLYLGYWIAECRKMAYKRNYQPLQILHNQHWHTLEQLTSL